MSATLMTQEEIAQIITLVRRAPLQNMAEAEFATQLMRKLAAAYAPTSEADLAAQANGHDKPTRRRHASLQSPPLNVPVI